MPPHTDHESIHLLPRTRKAREVPREDVRHPIPPHPKGSKKIEAKPKKLNTFLVKNVAPGTPPSAALPVEERADVGARFPVEKLMFAYESLASEWQRDQAALAAYKLDAPWAAGVDQTALQVISLATARGGAATGGAETGVALDDLVGKGKGWPTAFGAIVGNSAIGNLRPKVAVSTSHSALALAESIEREAEFANQHLAQLAASGGTAAFVQAGKDLAASLRKSHGGHLDAIRDLSPAALDLQAAKGTLYLELKRLCRAARVLPRARREKYVLKKLLGRRSAAEPAPAPAPTPALAEAR